MNELKFKTPGLELAVIPTLKSQGAKEKKMLDIQMADREIV